MVSFASNFISVYTYRYELNLLYIVEIILSNFQYAYILVKSVIVKKQNISQLNSFFIY